MKVLGRIRENLKYILDRYLCQSKVEGYQFLTCLAGQTDHVPVALTLKCGLWNIQNSKILFQQSQKSLFSTQGLIKKNLCTLGLTLLNVCQDHVLRPCQFDPMWSNVIQCDPIWSNLIQYGPMWSNLIQFVPIRSILIQFVIN